MQLKRHDLLSPLSLFLLLSLLVFVFLVFARQSVQIRVYDALTGGLVPHAVVESLTPAQQQATPLGWLLVDVNRRISVSVTADGYLPAKASWCAAYPWTRRGRLDVTLSPTQLAGIVRDAETDLPLSDATVSIGVDRVTTDAGGMFHFRGLVGDMPVTVQLDGYETGQEKVLWESHLLRGQLLTVDLQPNFVEGQVRWQQTGGLLAGASVAVIGQQQVTDQAGHFYLRRLRVGDIIVVTQEGFWPAEVTYTGQPLDIGLMPNFLAGQVHWQETGEPLSGVTVMAAGKQQVTDTAGRFRQSQLQVGDTITIERKGFWPLEMTYTGQYSEIDIALRDRQAQVAVRSALEGVELSGLEVTRQGQHLTENTFGNFLLRTCEARELVEARAEGHWPMQVRLAASIVGEAQGVEKIDMRLKPRVLTVTVRDDYTGWPLGGALVKSSPGRLTDALGQVALSPAMPGMTGTVEYPGYEIQTFRYDGQASKVEVRLSPHTIQGIVVDAATGEPLPGAALRRDGQTLLRTASDGSFYLEEESWQPAFAVRLPGYRLTQVVIGDPASPVVPRSCPGGASGDAPCWEIQLLPFEVRGVYIPFGLLYARQRTLTILDMIADSELNAIVLDVKGDRGWLAYASELALAEELGVSVRGVMDIHEFLDICHRRGIYAIARLVVFKDNPLAFGKPDLAVKQADGSVWLDKEKLGWGNPYREQVWNYNIGIAQEMAQLGFDEIQLDYVRFPSDGELDKIVYQEENTSETKTTAIRTFMAHMRQALESYDVFLSADVFGLTLVVDPQSGMGIGQRVIDIAPYVDYLCPMVYPSTFIPGNLGIANPALRPYKVVAESLRQGMALTSTLVRPWLQAYSLDGVEYGLARQNAQRWAAENVGASGWTFWNAGGRYEERLFQRCVSDDVERRVE